MDWQTGRSGSARTLKPQLIRADATKLASLRRQEETLTEVSPAGSSNALGAVERWAESIAGLVRTIVLEAGKRLGHKIHASDPRFAWAVRHAAFLHNRFQVHATGTTGLEQIHHRSYHSALLPVATPVMIRSPQALEHPKLEARWSQGLWLGRKVDSDEHIAGGEEGVLVGRSCKMMEDPDSLKVMAEKMVWTPSYPKPRGEEDEEQEEATPPAAPPQPPGGECRAAGSACEQAQGSSGAPRIPCELWTHNRMLCVHVW